jgi:hypothetical protein
MTKPKFKIGDRLFYKGHLHCVIMDIIQESNKALYSPLGGFAPTVILNYFKLF